MTETIAAESVVTEPAPSTDVAPPIDDAPATEIAPPIEEAFDATAFEQHFGYPAGSFAGAKNADDVLAKIAEGANKSFFDDLETDDADPGIQPAAANESYEALRARLAEQESQVAALQEQIQQNEQAQLSKQQAAIERRIDAAINGFASPKYGVGLNRTLKQTREAAAFKTKLLTHIAGLTEADQIPVIEVLADRFRRFEDDTYNPTAKPADRTPLGSPGTSKATKGAPAANAPRNIHECLLRNPN